MRRHLGVEREERTSPQATPVRGLGLVSGLYPEKG